MASRSSYVSSLLDELKVSTERAFRGDLRIVYTAADRSGRIVIGLMNIGAMPIKLLELYINGSPISQSEGVSITIECQSRNASALPITILSEDLCLLKLNANVNAECYDVTIATDEGSYNIRVYA